MSVTMQQVLAILNAEEPEYGRVRALGPDALLLLDQLVHGTDQMLASKAASAASAIGGPAAVGVLEHASLSPMAAVRVNAAGAVSQLAAPLGAGVLTHLLSDPDIGVRRQALRAAVGRLNPVLRARIQALSTSDNNARLRAQAAEILRRP